MAQTENSQNRLKAVFWFICSISLVYFIYKIVKDYAQQNVISIISHLDPPKESESVKVIICNEAYIDARKVLSYNGSINLSSYEFLKQAVGIGSMGNDTR